MLLPRLQSGNMGYNAWQSAVRVCRQEIMAAVGDDSYAPSDELEEEDPATVAWYDFLDDVNKGFPVGVWQH